MVKSHRQLRLQGHPLAATRRWSWSWPAASTSSAARTSSRSATVGPARPTWPSVSAWRPARRASRSASSPPSALVHELIEARDDKQLLRFQKKLATYKLLIVDELGFVPLSKTGARAVVRGVQPTLRAGLDPDHHQSALRRMDRGVRLRSASPARSSIASPTIVNILEMNGDSYRLNQSRRRQTARRLTEPTTQPTLDPVGPQVPPARAVRVSLVAGHAASRAGPSRGSTGTSPQPPSDLPFLHAPRWSLFASAIDNRSQRDVYYTHVYQGIRESLDHILVSEEFYDIQPRPA